MNATCDACSVATAHVRVQSPATGSSLDFCSHDFDANADELLLQGFTLIAEDTRAELVARPELVPAATTPDDPPPGPFAGFANA